MWDKVVDVPRLVHTYMPGDPLPHALLDDARDALSSHYVDELGEPFVSAGCCNYRDWRDSVAWAGDDPGRGRPQDTMAAIFSLGDQRRHQLRPHGGVRSVPFARGHRHVCAMGGVSSAHGGNHT